MSNPEKRPTKLRSKFDNLDPSTEVSYAETREAKAFATNQKVQQEFFERTVAAAWMAHRQGKNLSAPAIVTEDPELPLKQVRLILNTKRFMDAMKARGIPSAELNRLTPEMLHLIATLADHSVMVSERTKVQKLGITWQQYQGWLDYPPFETELRRRTEKGLDRAVTLGDTKLGELISNGNLQAIQYANLKTGRFDPNARQMQSVSYIMSMALTIIHKRVKDPDLLLEIASDFGRLASGAGIQMGGPEMLQIEEKHEPVYPPLSGDDPT